MAHNDPRGVPEWVAAQQRNRNRAPQPLVGRALSLDSWDAHPPPTAQGFYTFTEASLVLPAGAGSTVSSTAATGGFLLVGPNLIAALKSVVFTIDAPALTTSIRLTIFQNDTPIAGLTRIGFPPISATTFALPINGTWQIAPGARLHGTFTRLDATGPTNVGLVLAGWQDSEANIYRYTGERRGQIVTVEAAEEFKRNLAV